MALTHNQIVAFAYVNNHHAGNKAMKAGVFMACKGDTPNCHCERGNCKCQELNKGIAIYKDVVARRIV